MYWWILFLKWFYWLDANKQGFVQKCLSRISHKSIISITNLVYLLVGELAGRPSTQRGTVQIYDFCQVQSIYFTKNFEPSKISVTNLENPGLLWRGCFTTFTKSLYFLNKTRNTSHLKKIIIPKIFIENQRKIANRLFVSFILQI